MIIMLPHLIVYNYGILKIIKTETINEVMMNQIPFPKAVSLANTLEGITLKPKDKNLLLPILPLYH